MNRFNMKDIIRFVDGEMDEQEKQGFELALQTDEALKQDYELYNQVNGTLKAKFNTSPEDITFKEKLKELNAEYFAKEKETPVRKIQISRFIYAAAVILLALFIWAPWNQDLYKKYSGTQMVSVAERGERTNGDLLTEATEAFNVKDYNTAKSKLKELLAQDTDNDMLKFYYGVSLLETNQPKVSRTTLNEVFNGESVFKDDAAFYIALSYIKEKDNNKAKEWLQRINQDADIYNKAQELLSKL